MDILVSSNFERYLFDLFDRDTAQLQSFMQGFGTQSLQVSEARWKRVRACFDSHSVNDQETVDIIRQVHRESGHLLDPHTAIGVGAARACNRNPATPMITLATAHPVIFPAALEAAGLAVPPLPPHLSSLFDREVRFSVVPNQVAAVTSYLQHHLPD
jgi:threonine synthase